MKKVRKVAIYLPHYQKNATKKRGFLTLSEVKKIENILKKNPKIKFLGNVNFKNIRVKRGRFLCGGIDLGKIGLFFWYAPGMRKFSNELESLSKEIKVLKNPKVFFIVADKFLAHSALKKKGLPVSEFALLKYNDLASMKRLIKKWKTVLIKPTRGSFGRGIIRVSDFETLRDIAGYLKMEHKQEQIFVEKFYENDLGKWISTTVIGGKVVYGYRKKKEKFAGWKVYDIKAKGGDAYYVDPAPVRNLAEKAAKVLDESIVGFDFIKTKEGYKIVDENNFPGFYPEAFQDAGKNVSELIAGLILKNALAK
jgi:ribosomal protein S6--L-glutamate ligase